MTVHVNEIHTDVTASGGGGTAQPTRARGGRSADDVWHESKGRAEWLTQRVRAEAFSD